MKLTNDYWAVRFAQNQMYQSIFVESMMNSTPFEFDSEAKEYRKAAMTLLSYPSEKHYFVSKKAQALARSIKFEKIKPSVFVDLPITSATIIVDKYRFYKIEKIDNKIFAVYFYPAVDSDKTQPLEFNGIINVNYNTFTMIAGADQEIRFSNQNELHGMTVDGIWTVDHQIEMQKLLWQILTFMHFAEPELLVVEANKKLNLNPAYQVEKNKITNESDISAILVASDWNRVTVVAGGFEVRGHLRFQPVGVGRKDVNLIWIDSYMKEGYTRGRKEISS